ncbi:MAG: S-adenosylmethionine decarboxylase [Ktedonobacteraceae bacterium]
MQHLLLDLYECNAQKLADADELRRFLGELPSRLGMQPAGPPDLYFIDSVSDPADAGHSGLTLACNHVSLHAWPPYRMVNIDIFSRTAFDETEAIAFARALFDPADIEINSVVRATRSLRHSGGAEKPVVPEPVVESKAEPSSPVAHRCLYQGPGRCTRSTGSAMMRYCAVHQDLLLPP